jgi:hypothetical protein
MLEILNVDSKPEHSDFSNTVFALPMMYLKVRIILSPQRFEVHSGYHALGGIDL